MDKETLEEIAERLYPVNNTGSMFMPSRDELNNSYKQEGFIDGYNKAKERMYSEEEVNELLKLLKQTTEYEVLQSFRDKVDQFKKK